MTSIQSLLVLAQAYGEAVKVEPSTVSWRVFGDGKKLEALRGGADITTGRFERALQWFDANWPEDGKWPESVSRPSLSKMQAAQ